MRTRARDRQSLMAIYIPVAEECIPLNPTALLACPATSERAESIGEAGKQLPPHATRQ